MDARRLVGLLVATAMAACVPTPSNQTMPADAGTAQPPNTTAAAPVASTAASPAAGSSAPPSFVRPTPNPSPTFLVYEVRAGDTLLSIARLFGTTGRSIAYWNRDRYPSLDPDSATYEPDRIRVGWTLLLIPTEVVAEDELPDPTPTPTMTASPGAASSGPS
jgi:LysM domain-containing protein